MQILIGFQPFFHSSNFFLLQRKISDKNIEFEFFLHRSQTIGSRTIQLIYLEDLAFVSGYLDSNDIIFRPEKVDRT